MNEESIEHEYFSLDRLEKNDVARFSEDVTFANMKS